jgi:gliding motility-associated protein GldE
MGINLTILFHPINFESAAELVFLGILLLCTALVSASEVAFFSLKPTELKLLEESKSKKNSLLLSLLNKPNQLLANILIANNFLNISIIVLSTYISHSFIEFPNSVILAIVFQVIAVTFLILLVGEIIPKVFATDHGLVVAKFMAFPIKVMSEIFYPLAWLLINSTSLVQKKLAIKNPNLSINDLSDAIEITSGSLSEEKNILKGIVKFGNTNVSEIMHQRLDIQAIEIKANLSKLLSIVVESGYSRIPVFDNTLDNIKGILFSKDLLPYIRENNSFNWQGLIKPAFFVPETKKIDDLLSEFQKNKIHLAIVIDEYGGTCGLVTMEDILEEVIGEISDESDIEEEILYKQLAQNVFLFEAKVLLNDFYKITSVDDSVFDDVKGEYETLAGLLLELKGDIPVKGDKIEYKNFTFIIESADNRRIKQIKIIIK